MYRRTVIYAAIISMAIVAVLSADTIPGGNVSGTWYQANSPYYINGNITIQSGDTLIIEPGVLVDFLGSFYYLTVHGILEAVGTETDSIVFTADTSWWGLYFENALDSSNLEFCVVEKAVCAILAPIVCASSNPFISHCRISNNTGFTESGAITLYGSNSEISYCTINGNSGNVGGGILCHGGSIPTIINCTITDNNLSGGGVYGGGITIDGSSNPVIDSCIISNNNAIRGGGIAVLGGSSCTITDCRISADSVYGTGSGRNGGGMYINSSGGSVVISNTIIDGCNCADYGGGLYIQNADSVSITRSIIDGNYSGSEGGILYSVDCVLSIDHCDMVNNNGLLTGITLNGATDMTLSNCIFRSQEWENIYFANYNSASVTYCDFYDWGAPQPFYGNVPAGLGTLVQTNYNGDSCDIYYNILLDPLFEDFPGGNYYLTDSSPCIDAGDPAFAYDPDSTITDMGVYWYIQGAVEEGPPRDLSPVKLTCSPVPFREQITISLVGEPEHRGIGKPEIMIYDVAGRLVREISLLPFSFSLGAQATWDGKDEEGRAARAGIYFISAGGSIKQKVVKVR
jgi:parallel beta-helix repeat protein